VRGFSLIATVLAAVSIAGSARAQEREIVVAGDRPYTVAQLGVGLLTLPAADVCLQNRPCTKGDYSIELDFWQLYRANRYFAVGAGASFAITPVTDTPPSPPNIVRSHTRSYFLVEATVRYYAVTTDTFEGWFGMTAGGVIVSDRYSIDRSEMSTAAIIGPRAATVRTEGGAIGALIGANWSFAPNWAVGLTARYMEFFLPHEAATTVFLDRATLTDQQAAINVGISCSYRIAL
jgi:hypothetical protein